MAEADGRGAVDETHLGAVRNGLVSYPDATLVGVFAGAGDASAVDEARPELAVPADLRERLAERRSSLRRRGMCEEGAHNAAWEELNVAERYREHLSSEAAGEALTEFRDRLEAGGDLVFVGRPGENSRCHRGLLVEGLDGG